MKSAPVFSVIVPCYNAAATIRATLQSVSCQTLEDWEAIVIDDGSGDDSCAIVEDIIRNESRIRLIRQKNSGVSKTRNHGAKQARGRFLAFLDADDLWHAAYLETIAAHLTSRPDIDLTFAVARIVGAGGKPTGSFSSQKAKNFATADFLSCNPTTTCSNLVVKRETFAALGGFPEDICHAEDQLFLLRAHMAGAGIEGVSEALVDYRINENGLSANLEAMRLGWEHMTAQAMQERPDLIAPLVARARALNLSYLARRALRVRSGANAWGYMRKALESDWTILTARPWPSIPLAAVCLLNELANQIGNTVPEKAS